MNTERALILQRLDRKIADGRYGSRSVPVEFLKILRNQINSDAKYERLEKALEAAE